MVICSQIYYQTQICINSMDFQHHSHITGVGLRGFGSDLLANHKTVMSELVARDKNRASVVMWSVANEPQSEEPAAKNYFQQVVQHTKALDRTRPVTAVLAANADKDQAWKAVDIVCLNR